MEKFEFEPDVKMPLKVLRLKEDSLVPAWLLTKAKQVLKKELKIPFELSEKVIELAGREWGSKKLFVDEIDSFTNGNFLRRLSDIGYKLYSDNNAYKNAFVHYSIHLLMEQCFVLDMEGYADNARLQFDVHYDVDWHKGDFGDSRSCWFEYEDVSVFRMKFRHMCHKRQALALRFWQNDVPVGRCFGSIHPNGNPILFNYYGEDFNFNLIKRLMLNAGLQLFKTKKFAGLNKLEYDMNDHIHGAYVFGQNAAIAKHIDHEWSDYERFSNMDFEEERLTYFNTRICNECGYKTLEAFDCEYCGAESTWTREVYW